MTFSNVDVSARDIIGPPNWYLDRPGFWNGACGPAACWAGGAQGVVQRVIRRLLVMPSTVHRDVALGRLDSLSTTMEAVLSKAGADIDADPTDRLEGRRRALTVRHVIERACTEIIDVSGRVLGPRPLIADDELQRRALAVQLYIRQCHGEADLELLGAMLRERDVTMLSDKALVTT